MLGGHRGAPIPGAAPLRVCPSLLSAQLSLPICQVQVATDEGVQWHLGKGRPQGVTHLEGSCVPGPARVGDPAGEQGGDSVSAAPGSTREVWRHPVGRLYKSCQSHCSQQDEPLGRAGHAGRPPPSPGPLSVGRAQPSCRSASPGCGSVAFRLGAWAVRPHIRDPDCFLQLRERAGAGAGVTPHWTRKQPHGAHWL